MVAGSADIDTFALAYAGCAAFAALLPLRTGNAIPGIVRAAFAVALTPLAAANVRAAFLTTSTTAAHGPYAALLIIASGGASIGLVSSAVLSAAASAGALIDQALCGSQGASVEQGGPIGLLITIGAALTLSQGGALTSLMLLVCMAPYSHPQHLTDGLAFVRVGTIAAVSMALPALCAHALATIASALVARVAPRINGLLLAPALSTPLVLAVTLAGAATLFAWMQRLSAFASELAR
ncbi:MAG: flagellar biosynthetic protein FliR [Candidatus Eremiobacteraeota bacterium]|nr:flagellar biosynthetic protein FliR [Candidatus Eremiobacteraeota bacterium]